MIETSQLNIIAIAHYLPTVILIVTLITIGIPSPTHSVTLGLNPSFSEILPTPAFTFSHSGFTIWISQTVYFTSEHIRLVTF